MLSRGSLHALKQLDSKEKRDCILRAPYSMASRLRLLAAMPLVGGPPKQQPRAGCGISYVAYHGGGECVEIPPFGKNSKPKWQCKKPLPYGELKTENDIKYFLIDKNTCASRSTGVCEKSKTEC